MSDIEAVHPIRPFLRNWVWERGHIGTRYLDCRDGQVKFDEGKRARFAAEAMHYVSLEKDADDPAHAAHAAGPPVHEGGLARFLHAAQFGKPEEAGTPADAQRAVQDAVELAVFALYQHDARQALARLSAEPLFENEIRAELIAEIRKKYVKFRELLAHFDFAVFHGLPAPLMTSDSPLIDWRVRAHQPFVSFPLGPTSLLVGTPSAKKIRIGPVQWKAVAQMGPLKDHNRYVVDCAHRWLVATSDEQLAAVQSRFAPPG